MTEEVQTEQVNQPADQQSAPTLGVHDLSAMVQIIDIVSERGAFKGPELESIGILRSRVSRFIEANQAAEKAAAEQAATTLAAAE